MLCLWQSRPQTLMIFLNLPLKIEPKHEIFVTQILSYTVAPIARDVNL